MASKYLGGHTASDFSSNFINIDKLCDIFSKTQETMNQKQLFQENAPDLTDLPKTKPKEHNCSNCNNSCNKITHLTPFEEDEIEDEESDQPYICEFCNALGYNNKYVPELCDNCSKCESCAEYVDDECDGCEYSQFRDGKFYREKIPESELFDEQELSKFDNIEIGKKGGNRLDRGTFTVTKM